MITVTAAIIEKAHTILVARKCAGLHLAGCWEFPGGKLEENETPEECLTRELMEEFGIRCVVGEYMGESIFDYGSKTIRLLGYMVRHLSGEFTLNDHDAIRWLTPEELANSLTELPWAPADIPLVQAIAARRLHEETMAYYNNNAANYVKSTISGEMQMIRKRFIEMLPDGAHVLDLGCGSGRDAKSFSEAGFQVTAMDASPAIADLASSYLGQQVVIQKAQDLDVVEVYHGIWACASLLHLPKWELQHVIRQLEAALRPAGVIYMSFKPQSDAHLDQRFFCYPHLAELKGMIENCDKLQFLESFQSPDGKAESRTATWLNIIARRVG